ncbi:MAG: HAD-IB family hydrolase [Actinomycetota bacterium]
MGIRDALAGKRILLTGVTGFLGTALLERLLVDTPVARLDLVVRGNPSSRLKGLKNSSAFDPAVERIGRAAIDRLFEEKVRMVTADLSAGPPPVADDVDLVIHTAATVQFDPPIDDAFRTNLWGSVRLYEGCAGRPFVHVSTAYVAGLTRGTQTEELLGKKADWRAEAAAAERMRAEVEHESRTPEALRRFLAQGRAERSRVGPQAIAGRAEDLRKEWIKSRLVDYGRARARSLGWPDVYAFTKALTEMALDELAGDNQLIIVRPSIIESALERPHPGWIEGFRMAEPLILAFGRGALPEFAGIPEGVLDIIPVDLVVNALLAAAARPLAGSGERRAVFQVCSGTRNPLKYRDMYEHTRSYFLAHPLPETNRGFYKVPEWSFPGKQAVQRRMVTAEKVLRTAERVVARLPRNKLARDTAQRVDRLRGQFDFIKRYAELYGAYVEAEVIHVDRNVQALLASLSGDDRRDFPFDAAAFSWKHYLEELHMPAVTKAMRGPSFRPGTPTVKLRPAEDPGRPVLAVLDIDGTIIDSNVLEPYLWLRMSEVEGLGGRLREVAALAMRGPGFLKAERRDRGEFLRRFYRLYEGVPEEQVRAMSAEILGELVLRRTFPAAVRRIREHRAAGHVVVLITAALDFCIEPLAPLADELIGAKLRVEDGVFTGDMDQPPLVGEARASWLRGYAEAVGADLSKSYGYADSMTDLPLLQAVGHPVAVNAEVALQRIARRRRWPMEEWPADPGTPRILIPSPPPEPLSLDGASRVRAHR